MDANIESAEIVLHESTKLVISDLQNGIVSWRNPWYNTVVPQNFITKTPYRGINIWLLSRGQYKHNYFLSTEDLKKSKFRLKENSIANIIVKESDVNSTKTNNYGIESIYNVSQIDEDLEIPSRLNSNIIEMCKLIIHNMPHKPIIIHTGKETFYNPLNDSVYISEDESDDDLDYYILLFHELAHATGHKSRLSRSEILGTEPFGSAFSYEELIADITTSYLLSYAGIPDNPYETDEWCNTWIKKIYENENILLDASNEAQKAIDYIFSKTPPGS